MDISGRRVSEIIGRIYEAGSDTAAWGDVLEQFRLVFGGSRVCLTRFAEGAIDTVQTDDDPDFLCNDALRAFQEDPLCKKALLIPTGRSYLQHEVVEQSAFRSGELWNEWYAPRDMYSGLSANLRSEDGDYWFLDIQRGPRQDEFERVDVQQFDLFLPHLLRAGNVASTAYLRSLETAVSAIDHGVMILTGNCRVVFANSLCEKVLSAPSKGLNYVGGRLSCASHQQTLMLHHLVRTASFDEPSIGNGDDTLFIPAPDASDGTTEGLMLRITPFHTRYDFGVRGRRLVMVRIRELGGELAAELFSDIGRTFKLTPAETRLAAKVASGRTLKEAAQDLGISITTARHHLQQIFGKTGTRQQSQLVALLRPA